MRLCRWSEGGLAYEVADPHSAVDLYKSAPTQSPAQGGEGSGGVGVLDGGRDAVGGHRATELCKRRKRIRNCHARVARGCIGDQIGIGSVQCLTIRNVLCAAATPTESHGKAGRVRVRKGGVRRRREHPLSIK